MNEQIYLSPKESKPTECGFYTFIILKAYIVRIHTIPSNYVILKGDIETKNNFCYISRIHLSWKYTPNLTRK